MKDDKLIILIRKYINEATNPRNDGYVQGHYKKILREALDLLRKERWTLIKIFC